MLSKTEQYGEEEGRNPLKWGDFAIISIGHLTELAKKIRPKQLLLSRTDSCYPFRLICY